MTILQGRYHLLFDAGLQERGAYEIAIGAGVLFAALGLALVLVPGVNHHRAPQGCRGAGEGGAAGYAEPGRTAVGSRIRIAGVDGHIARLELWRWW